MEQLKSIGNLALLKTGAFWEVKIVDFLLKSGQMEWCFGEIAFWCELFDLLMFEFFEEEIFLDVCELFMEVIW